MLGEEKFVILVLTALFVLIKEIDCLQCYNCAGITNYDTDSCFNPEPGSTLLQECHRGEVCEKKISTVDRLQDAIERGCSSNCDGRKYIWTDSFRVYCCEEENKCNHGDITTATHLSLLLPLALVVWTMIRRMV
ncbi:hypothetical protein CAPTEDRAFT_229277 [Capitella teleta]|uniref:UPAR/Ly6 domain-containing protein n=1 Tax=Capitella teleta TaxID=283909 RepID=R7UK44_CAPTE|nr:hypothetical protein CAPTEDRAFT_229277 [Capitella teleta]|eukprot:ELU06919.1 hypothetical protein CAPTEDRAFT_229277 [Capitella teleta]